MFIIAHFVMKAAYLRVAGTDLHDHVRQVTVNYEAEIQDDTNMGDTARNKLSGLTNWTAAVEYAQDFAASEVDATHFSLIGSTDRAWICRPTTGNRSATNPDFSGRALIASYPPLGNSVGELATASINYEGTGTLDRLTSST